MSDPRRYCKHCQQSFVTDETERCPLCRATGGLVDAESAEALAHLLSSRQAEAGQNLPVGDMLQQGVRHGLWATWLLKLFLAGLVCVALGVFLLLHPDFRTNRNRVMLSDLLPGLGALFVGAALLGLMIFVLVRMRQEGRRQQAEAGSSVAAPDSKTAQQ